MMSYFAFLFHKLLFYFPLVFMQRKAKKNRFFERLNRVEAFNLVAQSGILTRKQVCVLKRGIEY